MLKYWHFAPFFNNRNPNCGFSPTETGQNFLQWKPSQHNQRDHVDDKTELREHTETEVKDAVWCVLVSVWFPHFTYKHAQSTVEFIRRAVERIQLQRPESTRTGKPTGHRTPTGRRRLLDLCVLLQHPVLVGVDAVRELEDKVGIGWWIRRRRWNIDWHHLPLSSPSTIAVHRQRWIGNSVYFFYIITAYADEQFSSIYNCISICCGWAFSSVKYSILHHSRFS